MRLGVEYLLFIASVIFCACTSVVKPNETDFVRTLKPLYCHDIEVYTARSKLECVLHCQYNCLGYSASRHNPSNYRCHVCFIYDIQAAMTVAPTPGNVVTSSVTMWNENGRSIIQIWNLNTTLYEISTLSIMLRLSLFTRCLFHERTTHT